MKKIFVSLFLFLLVFVPLSQVFAEEDNLPPSEISNLSYIARDDVLSFSWTNSLDDDFSSVNIYRDGVLITSVSSSSYDDMTVQINQQYVYRFTTVDSNGNESQGIQENITFLPHDQLPPNEVSNLSETHDDNSVILKWTNPSDEDFSGIRIYQGTAAIKELGVETQFIVEDLEPSKDYSFRLTTLDKTGNESKGKIITLKTDTGKDIKPPSTPLKFVVNEGKESAYLSWDKSPESDLKGYNVYLDGQKINDDLINETTYIVPNLTNGHEYTFKVSAVDDSGNESPLSTGERVIPSADSMPSITIGDYDLQDATQGIQSWFHNIWVILAFFVGIPVSFYVAGRIKLMMID